MYSLCPPFWEIGLTTPPKELRVLKVKFPGAAVSKKNVEERDDSDDVQIRERTQCPDFPKGTKSTEAVMKKLSQKAVVTTPVPSTSPEIMEKANTSHEAKGARGTVSNSYATGEGAPLTLSK
ncbi:hypothetical protein EVAR_28010_1 [Eumeta japonica]|uniref:Uncharacterized protein n=1 Tax=Eumeta variegata TaxID=151549 RepID=A0A4C1WEL5_EUMVA|nr:hypothetical protein EVAR_28010_1 [Eumeta japonica]